LFQDEVIEVSARVQCCILEQGALWQQLGHLLDQFSSQADQHVARHQVVSIVNVGGGVGKTRCLEETKYIGCVTSTLHAHQALLVDGDWKLASFLHYLVSFRVLSQHLIVLLFLRLEACFGFVRFGIWIVPCLHVHSTVTLGVTKHGIHLRSKHMLQAILSVLDSW